MPDEHSLQAKLHCQVLSRLQRVFSGAQSQATWQPHLICREPVALQSHGLQLATDVPLLEGAPHGNQALLQAVLLPVALLKDIPELLSLRRSWTMSSAPNS